MLAGRLAPAGRALPVGRAALAGRTVLAALLVGSMALGSAGCTPAPSKGAPKGTAEGARRGPDNRPPVPAAEIGGACQLLDYGTIRQALGISFAVAAAADRGETHTCLVQQRRTSFPDLVLSVSQTGADENVFRTVMAPAGSAPVAGLGKIAYSRVSPPPASGVQPSGAPPSGSPAGSAPSQAPPLASPTGQVPSGNADPSLAPSAPAGPIAEVGWLTGNRRLIVLRLRLTADASAEQANAFVPKLVDLAKTIDYTTT